MRIRGIALYVLALGWMIFLAGCGDANPKAERTVGGVTAHSSSSVKREMSDLAEKASAPRYQQAPAESAFKDALDFCDPGTAPVAERCVSINAGSLGATPACCDDGANDPAPNVSTPLVPHLVRPHEGHGPGVGGDKFEPIVENEFHVARKEPLSTFSIDVDTASYSKMRQYLAEMRTLPPPDAVRIEELINYFDYNYASPTGEHPFAAHVEVGACPWQAEHKLVRVGLKGRTLEQRPPGNLVFLVDVSGSMDQPNKLPLVKRGLEMLTRQLGENDRVAIVVYAGAAGLVLNSTLGSDQPTILSAIARLQAGGSTNGGEGIKLAYRLAREHFLSGGVNRVILCTDGDFNVGTTSTGELVRLAEDNAKSNVFLSVLGFGMGNHNDSMLEQISNKANGNYAFIDTPAEAHKVLVEQMSGTLVTIAKDVKIQIEFNPARVQSYRLVGYENRILAARDFNDDKKDAGEIGAGHTVTALYEIVPANAKNAVGGAIDALKYQAEAEIEPVAHADELLTLKLRYKQPTGDVSRLLELPVPDASTEFARTSSDFQFVAAVAGFGMLLRDSPHKGTFTFDAALEIAGSAQGSDKHGHRREFAELVLHAKSLRRLAGE